ncbi:MAG: zinc ribbon domain-containing protein [Verrucomicrobiae bacterium]|nr:zinc ribbon domain-containing protein [Verrucomicrobiae bacterium]
MPTYQYECRKCKKGFELYQSIKDDAIKTCPKDRCRMKRWGKGQVKRLMGTGAGLIFKGSGFYITDYRSDSYKAAAKKDAEAASPKKTSETPASPPQSPEKKTSK